MNFIPCRLEDIAELRPLTDRIVFPLPPLRPLWGVPRTDKLLLGLRPEHITEAKPHSSRTWRPSMRCSMPSRWEWRR